MSFLSIYLIGVLVTFLTCALLYSSKKYRDFTVNYYKTVTLPKMNEMHKKFSISTLGEEVYNQWLEEKGNAKHEADKNMTPGKLFMRSMIVKCFLSWIGLCFVGYSIYRYFKLR